MDPSKWRREPLISYVESRDGNDTYACTGSELRRGRVWRRSAATIRAPGYLLFLTEVEFGVAGQLCPKGSGGEHPITVRMYGGGVKPVITAPPPGWLFEALCF